MEQNRQGFKDTLEGRALQHRVAAEHYFEAVEALDKLFGVEGLASDYYTDIAEMRCKLLVRAGQSEGEAYGIEESLIPIREAALTLLEEVPASMEGEEHQFHLGVVQALSVVEEAAGLTLWGIYNPED